MAKINLLPWRQAYREEKKREFITILFGVALLSVLCAYIWISSVEAAIENQNSRNKLLQDEIAKLEAQVKEIADIKKVREDLLARIKVIQDLEGTRPVIVRYFDDFVRAIPQPASDKEAESEPLNKDEIFGLYITSMSKKGNVITLEGVADSYNRVAAFMRKLDDSEWFADPKLHSVAAAPSEGEQANSFKMTVNTSAPLDEQKPSSDEGGKK